MASHYSHPPTRPRTYTPTNQPIDRTAPHGAQKWVLLPPRVTPPGVHPSEDGLDLATPVTLAEWFEGFYTEAAKGPVRALR